MQLAWLVWKKHVKVNGRLCPSPAAPWRGHGLALLRGAILSPADSRAPRKACCAPWLCPVLGSLCRAVHPVLQPECAPHKPRREPTSFRLSLPGALCPPFQRSLSVFMGRGRSFCPWQTAVALRSSAGRTLPLAAGSHCCIEPVRGQSSGTMLEREE